MLPHPTGPLSETPERRPTPELAVAWRAGLEELVELPYAAPWAERLSASTLAVSVATRSEPREYQRALLSFAVADDERDTAS